MTITTAGLTIKRFAGLREDLRARIASKIATPVQTGPDTVLGQLLDIVAAGLADLWESVQATYDSFQEVAATGAQLDNLAALVGVERQPATRSKGLLTITVVPPVTIPVGTLYRVANGPVVRTVVPVTIPGPLNSADVEVEALETGPIEILANAVDTIVTVIAGVDNVANASDFTLGSDQETDVQLRIRRRESLQVIGAGPYQAIRSRLVALDTVIAAVVLNNATSMTDANGVPAHSFEAIVWPVPLVSEQASIFQAIWDTKPAGITAHGDTTGTATDTQGQTQAVAFSAASEQVVHLVAALTTATQGYPADGDDQVRAALIEEMAKLSIGDDVLRYRLEAAIADIPGILSLEVRLAVGATPLPSDLANISVALGEIATVASANIDVLS